MKQQMIKTAFLRTLPVMAGYMVLGIGFGITLENNGYGIWWALAMSGLIYAGSMQYVAIPLLTSGASLASCRYSSRAMQVSCASIVSPNAVRLT